MSQEHRSEKILVVNPGGTSTKIAVYRGEEAVFGENVRHDAAELARFAHIYDQLDWRLEATRAVLASAGIALGDLDAVVGRGAALAPVPSGVFAVDAAMLDAIRAGRVLVHHASELGAPLAHAFARGAGCPAYIADPVSVDEMLPEAKLTGLPQLPRRALGHALSVKAASRHAAAQLGRPLAELDLIVLHLGSGITVAAQRRGRQVDHNDPTATGPMAPTRAGGLPALDLARFVVASGMSAEALEELLVQNGGWKAHLGTDDVREIYARIDAGDASAKLVLDATQHQIAREAGGLLATLRGHVDAIVITGGVARSERFVHELEARLDWIGAPFVVIPGEDEMLALAQGALRALRGEAEAMAIGPYLEAVRERSGG
jgi:butyrate kinase